MSWRFSYLRAFSPQEITFSRRLVRFSPAEVDIQVALTWPVPLAGLRLAGRLVGPRCLDTTTVEVAYPFRPLSGPTLPGIAAARVIVPEPCLWDPTCPFLYQGILEVYHAERLLARLEFCQGLRRFALSHAGLRCNEQRLRLRGLAATDLTATRAQQLRARGINSLLLPSLAAAQAVADVADCCGMLLFVRGKELEAGVTPEQERRLYRLSTHACFLACLLPAQAPFTAQLLRETSPAADLLWGLEGIPPASWEQLPARCSFLAGTPHQLPALRRWPLPKVLLTPPQPMSEEPQEDVLGLVVLEE